MALAETFAGIVDSLPDDWTDLELDLRIADEHRYVDAAVMLSQVNAQPYSRADWHWRLNVAHGFGHAAAPETVKGVLAKLDREGIGESCASAMPRRGGRRWCRCGGARRAFAVSSASGGTFSARLTRCRERGRTSRPPSPAGWR